LGRILMKRLHIALILVAAALTVGGTLAAIQPAKSQELVEVPGMTPIAYCEDQSVTNRLAGMARTPSAMQEELDRYVGEECDRLAFTPIRAADVRPKAVSFGPCKAVVQRHAFKNENSFVGYVLYMEDRCLAAR